MNPDELVEKYVKPLFTREFWKMLGEYMGIGKRRSNQPITNRDVLSEYIGSRASHVAQASLYGYLRTRAGTRFPTLFENPDLLQSINFAKWHVWLACVSDLGIYLGQTMHQSGDIDEASIRSLLPAAIEQLFDETGVPEEAGPDFAAAREKVLQRVTACDWKQVRDDDTVFSQSPEALYYWSPIADELKENDESIVKNSIRYRWIEIRRDVRAQLDCEALAQSLGHPST